MIPKIIIHNTISLDGRLNGFDSNLEKYYNIAGKFKEDAVLVGSNTAKIGIGLFLKGIPKEDESDFKKPIFNKDNPTPYWVTPDTKGLLKNLLHVYRRTKYCKDVIILICKKTPISYIEYLENRSYDYIKTGMDHIDIKKALNKLNEKYEINLIRSDSGGILNSILLKEGLVDKISLLLYPGVVGNKFTSLFNNLCLDNVKIDLELLESEVFDDGNIWLYYKIKK